jgi:hypothetical protein
LINPADVEISDRSTDNKNASHADCLIVTNLSGMLIIEPIATEKAGNT